MSLIRYLSATEIPLLRDHLLRLDPEDRRMRFGGASLKPAAVDAYCRSILPAQSLIIGHFDSGQLRAVAQIAFLAEPVRSWIVPPWSAQEGSAEVAISVERDWQNTGVGTRLFSRAVIVARNRNIARLIMLCLPENEKMKRLAVKCGVRLRFHDGEVLGEADLDRPDILTIAAEGFGTALGVADGVLDELTAAELKKSA